MIREPYDMHEFNGHVYHPYQPINTTNNNNIRTQSTNITVPHQYPPINSNMQSINYQHAPVAANLNYYSPGNSVHPNPPAAIPNQPGLLVQPNRTSRNNHRTVTASQRFYKMDGIFAQSFTSVKNQSIIHTVIVSFLLLGVILLYRFDLFKSGNQGYSHGAILYDGQLKQSVLPLLFLAELLIIVLKLIIYFKTYNRVEFALQSANSIGHVVRTEQADCSKSLQQNTSRTYLLMATEVRYDQGMDDSIKTLHKSIAISQIRLCSKSHTYCTTQLHELIEFGMFICGIYLIMVLAQDQTTWMEKMLLITTIVYWFLQNYMIIVYTIVLLLCPLIVIVVIGFACCYAGVQRRQLTVPQPVTPTNQQIVNCGGTCSICMMQFTPTSSAIILPCSDKHMFHQMCINTWLRVKTTCPNCRYDLAA